MPGNNFGGKSSMLRKQTIWIFGLRIFYLEVPSTLGQSKYLLRKKLNLRKTQASLGSSPVNSHDPWSPGAPDYSWHPNLTPHPNSHLSFYALPCRAATEQIKLKGSNRISWRDAWLISFALLNWHYSLQFVAQRTKVIYEKHGSSSITGYDKPKFHHHLTSPLRHARPPMQKL